MRRAFVYYVSVAGHHRRGPAPQCATRQRGGWRRIKRVDQAAGRGSAFGVRTAPGGRRGSRAAPTASWSVSALIDAFEAEPGRPTARRPRRTVAAVTGLVADLAAGVRTARRVAGSRAE